MRLSSSECRIGAQSSLEPCKPDGNETTRLRVYSYELDFSVDHTHLCPSQHDCLHRAFFTPGTGAEGAVFSPESVTDMPPKLMDASQNLTQK